MPWETCLPPLPTAHFATPGDLHRIQQSLHDLQNEFPALVSNARGKGLYRAFDLPSSEDRDKLANLLLDEGSILLGSGNYSIRFRPHLNVTEDDINFGMDCFRRALNKLL